MPLSLVFDNALTESVHRFGDENDANKKLLSHGIEFPSQAAPRRVAPTVSWQRHVIEERMSESTGADLSGPATIGWLVLTEDVNKAWYQLFDNGR